jgi:hypothetical protein
MEKLEKIQEVSPQESILKRREIIAPPGFVSVFHETSDESIQEIDRKGLMINTEIKSEDKSMAMKLSEIIDKFRPDALKSFGISRNNIYAHPVSDDDKVIGNGKLLELKVDPRKCYVGDMNIITDIAFNFRKTDKVRTLSKEYWDNLITLDIFLRWYKKAETAEGSETIKNPEEFKDDEPTFTEGRFYLLKNGSDDYPSYIDNPEVLIPQNIPQQHIRVVE